MHDIVGRIRRLEEELLVEIQKKEEQFYYEVRDRRVHFEEKIRAEHSRLSKTLARYLLDANVLNALTAPVIWFCLIPALFIDLTVIAYQFVCFPAYGIPKVKRSEYIVLDRRYLAYLNPLEKVNCIYCEYINGMIAFIQEVAARTEQYWCPIKHARKMRAMHSRYGRFIDYGDAAKYRDTLESVRRDFGDLG
jgi:hypothetical protein